MRKSPQRFVRYWLGPLLWAAVVITLTVIRLPESTSEGFDHTDKIAHGAMFAVLAFLLFRALRDDLGLTTGGAAIVAFVMCVVFGIVEEVVQLYIPYRDADFKDCIANTVGAALVFLACAMPSFSRKTYIH